MINHLELAVSGGQRCCTKGGFAGKKNTRSVLLKINDEGLTTTNRLTY